MYVPGMDKPKPKLLSKLRMYANSDFVGDDRRMNVYKKFLDTALKKHKIKIKNTKSDFDKMNDAKGFVYTLEPKNVEDLK